MSLTSLLDPVWEESLAELAAVQRRRASDFAAEAVLLARLESRTVREDWQADQPYDSLLLEVAGSCLVGQDAAHRRIDQGVHLVRRLPRLLSGLESGEVLVPQARVVIEETLSLSAAVCAEVDSRIAAAARAHQPGALRRKVRALVLLVDAEEAARRAAKGKQERTTWTRSLEDGQALLVARGPAEQVRALELRLDAEARAARAAGDTRTLEQLRFDLLCGSTPGALARPLQALIHVPVATALGISDAPGFLDGYGPLCAATARELLTDAELRKVCVDGRTGRVVGVDSTVHRPAGSVERVRTTLLSMVEQPLTVDEAPEPQHDPSAALARAVRLRDPSCDGVGCSMPASRCELDHKLPWPTGPTSFQNLRPRSPRCHHAKHHGWTVICDPDGTSHWTSPGGRTYTVPTRDRPPPDISSITSLPTPDAVRRRDRALLRESEAHPAEKAA